MLAGSIAKLASSVRAAQKKLEGRLACVPVEEVAMTAGGTRDDLIQSYAECFKSTGALVDDEKCKTKLEEMVRKNYRDEAVREAFESLVSAEEDWAAFLKRFEAKWTVVNPPLFEGSSFSKEGDAVPEEILSRQFTEVASKQTLCFSDIISQASFTLLLFFRVIG